MVNVNTPLPFNLHNKAAAHLPGSVSADSAAAADGAGAGATERKCILTVYEDNRGRTDIHIFVGGFIVF